MNIVKRTHYTTEDMIAESKTSIQLPENDTKNDLPENVFEGNWYYFAFLEGAVVMAIEMLVVGMISPYFGASLYIWGSVIGVTFSSLAVAYYLGGYIGDRYPQSITLYRVILISAIIIMILPAIAEKSIAVFSHSEPMASVIIISSILLIPSIGTIGMISTMLIRICSKTTAISGRITGNIFTVSSIGGIISIFVMGYYVIPSFGISYPTFMIGIITGIVPFILLILQKTHLAPLFVIFIFFGISLLPKKEIENKDIKVHRYSEGLLGQILVVDIKSLPKYRRTKPTKNRILFINRIGQTFEQLKNGKSWWGYPNYIVATAGALPKSSDVLLLGLGGGTIANNLRSMYKCRIDAVELDERIPEIAKEYFNLSDSINIFIDDARHYIETTNKKYDLIVIDLFRGESPPAHVLPKSVL